MSFSQYRIVSNKVLDNTLVTDFEITFENFKSMNVKYEKLKLDIPKHWQYVVIDVDNANLIIVNKVGRDTCDTSKPNHVFDIGCLKDEKLYIRWRDMTEKYSGKEWDLNYIEDMLDVKSLLGSSNKLLKPEFFTREHLHTHSLSMLLFNARIGVDIFNNSIVVYISKYVWVYDNVSGYYFRFYNAGEIMREKRELIFPSYNYMALGCISTLDELNSPETFTVKVQAEIMNHLNK